MENKIYKGYKIAGDNHLTEAIFQTFRTFDNLEIFLQEEEGFSEWLKEQGKTGNINNIEELKKLFIKYNEGDELQMFYSFENIDNTKELLFMYKTTKIDEAIKLHQEYTQLCYEVDIYSDCTNSFDKIRYEEAREELATFEKKHMQEAK